MRWPKALELRCAADAPHGRRRADHAAPARPSPASRPASTRRWLARLDGPRWLDGLRATLGDDGRAGLAAHPPHPHRRSTASRVTTARRCSPGPEYAQPWQLGMPAVPGARVGDGKLDLLLAGALRPRRRADHAARVAQGHAPAAREDPYRAFQSMQFESDRELPLAAADGEPLEPLRRFEVRVRGGGAGGQREAAAPARGAASSSRRSRESAQA